MRRSALVAAVVLTGAAAASVIACASILGIQDGVLDTGQDDDGSVNICSADSGVQADSSQLFVAAEIGDDTAGCTEQTPCKTIGAAIATAQGHSEFHIIYVASINPKNNKGIGVYPESITLPPNMEIQGGWYARGRNPSVQWQQVCDATIEDQTANLMGAENITIHAENLNGSATLTKIVIRTKDPAPGESVYGIFTGATAKITLNQVRIDIGNGGDGVAGSTGTDGNPGSGTCSIPGTGTDGLEGDSGASAPQTVFNATGAVSANGTSGADGQFGSNGMVGSDGGCAPCVTCVAGGSCGNATTPKCGTPGPAGCAGAGGGGGGPGQSGGSSIGIYAWGGLVSVNGGIVHSGKGGSGGPGGLGGKGGIGSDGAGGAESSSCDTSCLNLGLTCPSSGSAKGSAGGSGTTGGRGGNGGTGASGTGGDSIAILSGIDASVLTDGGDSVDIAAGAPGNPGGSSAARYP